VKTTLSVVPTSPGFVEKPDKRSLYHAHLDVDGTCKGYERHMRRGSAVRSVYGYLVSFVKEYPNSLNYVFPSKRRIQEHTYKWIRVDRKTWVKSDENYSRRQIYSALWILTEIDAITPAQRGWIIRPHAVWAEKTNGVCRIRHLERVQREQPTDRGIHIAESAELLVPVLPKDSRTRVTILEDAIRQMRARR
jgi:hypothetical protein